MTAHNEMIERVAVALYEATPFKETEGDFHEQSDLYQRCSRVLARAAIEAMREPAGAMQASMRDAIEPYVQRGLSKPVDDQWQIGREVWAAAIDAALTDEVKT